MSVGSFVFMLHSHLPFYRKAGMWPFGEESVYECMAESYIPLLNAIGDLWDEGIGAKLTIGLTPILTEQLADEHLNQGFDKFLRDRIEAAQLDEKRYSQRGETPNADYLHLARFYLNWFQQIRRDYHERWNRDIIGAFRHFQDLGAIEIATSAATHCFSPLLETDSSLFGQYKVGVESYKRHFGRDPKGFWLPECAYRPQQGKRPPIEKWLHDLGLRYFFTESFVIKGGQSAELRRVIGPYGSIEYVPAAPRPETGLDTFEAFWLKEYPVAVLGRHEQAGYQVWSADHGYPGDGNYREFHKKDDRSGLHYWKLTSKTTDLGKKELYNPEAAATRLNENSDHYAGFLQQVLTDHLKKTHSPGLIMVSFDTELFGHWWFEGVTWIKEVIKKLRTYTAVTMRTGSEYLDAFPPTKAIELPESSWGSGGHWQVWYNNDTEWMWPIIHESEHMMEKLAADQQRYSSDIAKRALKQAARELLLLESSDWPFLVTTGQAKQYAIERFNTHKDRFKQLCNMIQSNSIDERTLSEIESIDNCFPDINPSLFRPQEVSATA
ncbi:MAG TPA: 1,4-alpha-glucan branching protein domain-containing protein [Candidatus Obscuribacterales bacterium]